MMIFRIPPPASTPSKPNGAVWSIKTPRRCYRRDYHGTNASTIPDARSDHFTRPHVRRRAATCRRDSRNRLFDAACDQLPVVVTAAVPENMAVPPLYRTCPQYSRPETHTLPAWQTRLPSGLLFLSEASDAVRPGRLRTAVSVSRTRQLSVERSTVSVCKRSVQRMRTRNSP